MFKPKGTRVSNEAPAQIDYKAIYTGVVEAEVLGFSPTREQIAEWRGLETAPDWLKVPEYIGNNNEGQPRAMVDVWLRFNPRELDLQEVKALNAKIKRENAANLNNPDYEQKELISEDSNLPGSYLVNFPIWVTGQDDKAKSGKFRWINESNQTAWGVDQAQVEEKFTWFKTESGRIAKEGEVLLYNLLASWSNLATDDSLDGFVIENLIDDLLGGDFEPLNALVGNENFKNEDGTNRKITILLGVQHSDSGYLRQKVFTNNYCNPFAKEGRQLGKRAKETAADYFDYYQGYLKFQVYDPTKVPAANTELAEAHDIDDEDYED
jgi:hypothetical protein